MERQLWQIKINRPQRSVLTLRAGALLLGYLLLSIVTATAVTFTASLDRETLSLGESARLSLTFDGAQPDGTPTPPPVPGLQFSYNGPSREYRMVNGQSFTRITHNFTVTPRQTGDFTIPAMSVTYDNQQLSTQPLQVKVLKPGAPSPEAVANGSQSVFLRLQLPKTNLYLGEVITGEYQLYIREGVGAGQFQFTGTPAEGITIGKMSELQRRRVQLGNFVYTVIPVAVALTPVKTGPLSVGPVTANIVVEFPSNNRRREGFDPFGMFGSVDRRQLSLVTEEHSIQCAPVPTEGQPADFTGAVGNFTMAVSVGPTNVATGDPITVRVEINGRGGLDGLTLAPQAAWENFKTYPPTTRIETSDPLGLQGTKIFEQIVSPENADIRELPPLSFSFFDPETKTFRTLTHPATQLTVRHGGSVVVPTIAAGNKPASDAPAQQLDIVPIKPHLGKISLPTTSQGFSRTFIALNVAPMVAFLGVIIWRKRSDALANNPRLRRQRQVDATLRVGLEKLRDLAAQNKSDEFFAELIHLLQAKLGAQLDLPASAITEAVIDEKLRPRGIPDSTLAELHELFQTTNLARYAPIKSSQALAAIIPKLESALHKLDEVKA